MHRVVKPFPYSVDGFTLIDLNVGDERDFGSMAGGLVAEGWIESVARVTGLEVPPVEFAVEPPHEAAVAETVEPAHVQTPRRKRK